MLIPLATTLAIAVLSIVFYLWPSWGLYSVIFLLPFERIGSYPLNPTAGYPVVRVVQVAGGALIIAVAGLAATKRLKLRPIGPIKWLCLIALSGAVAAWHIRYGQIWRNYVIALFVFALFFAVAQLATPERLRGMTQALLLSVLAVGCFGIYQYFGDLAGLPGNLTGLRSAYAKAVFGFPRIQATALEPLYYADYLMIPIFVGLSLLVVPRPQGKRILLPLAVAVAALNLVLTMSRGGLIAFVFGLIAWFWLMRRELLGHSRRLLKRVVIPALVIIMVAVAVTGAATYSTRHSLEKGPVTFLQLITTKLTKTGSFTDRVSSQQVAKGIFMQNPVWGVGISGFGPKVLNYPPKRLSQTWPIANNAFWELLAELGLVGFVGYVLMVGESVARGTKRLGGASGEHRAWLAGLVAAVIAIMVQYQTFSGFFLTHIWVALALLAGLSFAPKASEN